MGEFRGSVEYKVKDVYHGGPICSHGVALARVGGDVLRGGSFKSARVVVVRAHDPHLYSTDQSARLFVHLGGLQGVYRGSTGGLQGVYRGLFVHIGGYVSTYSFIRDDVVDRRLASGRLLRDSGIRIMILSPEPHDVSSNNILLGTLASPSTHLLPLSLAPCVRPRNRPPARRRSTTSSADVHDCFDHIHYTFACYQESTNTKLTGAHVGEQSTDCRIPRSRSRERPQGARTYRGEDSPPRQRTPQRLVP
eukprot:1180144-Prorocentrum_minimum.AAC.2